MARAVRPHRNPRSVKLLHGRAQNRRVESEVTGAMGVTVAVNAIVRAAVIHVIAIAVAVVTSRAAISRHKRADATLTPSARIASLASNMPATAHAVKRRLVLNSLVNKLNLLPLLPHPEQKALPLHLLAMHSAVSSAAAVTEASAASEVVVAVVADDVVAAAAVERTATSATKAAARATAAAHRATTLDSSRTNLTPAAAPDRAHRVRARRRTGLNLSITPNIVNTRAKLRPRRRRRSRASPKLTRRVSPPPTRKAATNSLCGVPRRAAAAAPGAVVPARRDATSNRGSVK